MGLSVPDPDSLNESNGQRKWLWRQGSQHDGGFRLFCVPCAGHGASMYFSWPGRLPREIEVWALQPPGRENRLNEEPFADVLALVCDAATALEPLVEDLPFAIFGHSMGALIGFELTRELRRRRKPLPRHLFMSGHAAPQLGVTRPTRCDLPDALFLDSVRELNTVLARDDSYFEAMRFMLPTLRADFALCERYRYVAEPVLPCDLSAWGGEADRETSVVDLAGWREQTGASFSLRVFPGDHFFPMSHRKAVIRALGDKLAPLVEPERRTPQPEPRVHESLSRPL
jgi:medium-chain acyl-[acyl-carrier-protein] hydrolase